MRHTAASHITVMLELYSSPLTSLYLTKLTLHIDIWACSTVTALHTLTTECGEIYANV